MAVSHTSNMYALVFEEPCEVGSEMWHDKSEAVKKIREIDAGGKRDQRRQGKDFALLHLSR